MKSGHFQIASFNVDATEFQYESKHKPTMALAVVVGDMIGVVIVLIARVMRGRRERDAAAS